MPATIAKHPIHPMLVVFPIALWIFSLVADLISRYGGSNPFWRDVAFFSMLGGFIGAVAAALPGLIDYVSIKGSVKRVATRHMTLNLIVIALYGVNLWLRASYQTAMGWPLTLSVVGVFMLTASTWLGGELVYAHGGDRKKEPSGAPERERRRARHKFQRFAH